MASLMVVRSSRLTEPVDDRREVGDVVADCVGFCFRVVGASGQAQENGSGAHGVGARDVFLLAVSDVYDLPRLDAQGPGHLLEDTRVRLRAAQLVRKDVVVETLVEYEVAFLRCEILGL